MIRMIVPSIERRTFCLLPSLERYENWRKLMTQWGHKFSEFGSQLMYRYTSVRKEDRKMQLFCNIKLGLGRVVPCPVPGWDSLSKSWPVPSRGKIFSLSRCPFVPGQGQNFCPVVPKSCSVPSRWKRY